MTERVLDWITTYVVYPTVVLLLSAVGFLLGYTVYLYFWGC